MPNDNEDTNNDDDHDEHPLQTILFDAAQKYTDNHPDENIAIMSIGGNNNGASNNLVVIIGIGDISDFADDAQFMIKYKASVVTGKCDKQ